VAEAGSRYQRFFNVHLPREGRRYHKVHALLDFMNELGISPVTQELKLHLTTAEQEEAAALWRSWGLDEGGSVVGVHVGGRSGKRWPVEHFLAVGTQLARDGVPTILFAGPEEGTLLSQHRPSIPAGVTIAPPLATRSFAAVLARCAAVVTGDTGPMHLAAAVGVPTVAVFLNSISRCYRPLGEGHRALFDEAGVTVDAAVAAVRETLSVR
jgi:ADP-heptose:LPS heptosyltransferase